MTRVEISNEYEPLSLFKTLAHFTFADGTANEGVLELDNRELRVKNNYVAAVTNDKEIFKPSNVDFLPLEVKE